MADDCVTRNPRNLATAMPELAIRAAMMAFLLPDAAMAPPESQGPPGLPADRERSVGATNGPPSDLRFRPPTGGPMPTVFDSPDDLPAAVGTHLGYTDWMEVDQTRIDLFAEATGDHQWIHVDRERAAAGPFGTTIAHGYLTLSLTNKMLPDLIRVDGISMGINYGTEKVRFPSPVLVDSRVRGGAELISVDEVSGGYQAVIRVTVEVEGSDRPACVVDSVSRFLR